MSYDANDAAMDEMYERIATLTADGALRISVPASPNGRRADRRDLQRPQP